MVSNEIIKPPFTANHVFCPKVTWINNSQIRVRLTGSSLKQDKETFNLRNVVNLFIVYELDRWSQDLNVDFTLKDCLFGVVKLIETADRNKSYYSGYSIGFSSQFTFFKSRF